MSAKMKAERGIMADPPPGVTRRELLKLSPLLGLGAFAVPSWRDQLLQAGVSWSDTASGLLFRREHAAVSSPDADVVPLERFPYNGYDVLEPAIDFETWALKVGGAVARPGQYNLDHIRALPKVVQNTRHVCVEGWDVVGRFGGARLGDFLSTIGADPSARFLTVTCADDYYESLDIETARHPQSLLCYEMYDRPLHAGHGAPLRLSLPTKVGYKHAKYLMTLDVTHVLPRMQSYWGDQGYSWYAGL
jgi:DMSO/TMAO reductase YedYZ molybdopterin-dependent catalytic subunit